MANIAHGTKSSKVLSDGYLVRKANENPRVRRFLDVYLKMADDDKLAVDAKLTQICNRYNGMGIVGAVELLMYVMEWRAAHVRNDCRNQAKVLRKGHMLEQAGWPAERSSA